VSKKAGPPLIGPHARLIEQGGLYRRLYETQFQSEVQRTAVAP
jgi:hypothetical protein